METVVVMDQLLPPHTPRVLLFADDGEQARFLDDAIRTAGYAVAGSITTSAALAEQANALRPDIIVIDQACPEAATLQQLGIIDRQHPCPVILFAKDDTRSAIQQAIRAGVSAYVVDGLSAHRIKALLEVAITRFAEQQALRQELEKARTSLAERKLIDRAKGVLMQRRGLNEEEAYQMLRKLAMDRGQRLPEVAQNLIAYADLLG